jgi:hypothetical protein
VEKGGAYESHIVPEQTALPCFVTIVKEPDSFSLVLPQMVVDISRNHYPLIKPQWAQMFFTLLPGEVRSWQMYLYDLILATKH